MTDDLHLPYHSFSYLSAEHKTSWLDYVIYPGITTMNDLYSSHLNIFRESDTRRIKTFLNRTQFMHTRSSFSLMQSLPQAWKIFIEMLELAGFLRNCYIQWYVFYVKNEMNLLAFMEQYSFYLWCKSNKKCEIHIYRNCINAFLSISVGEGNIVVGKKKTTSLMESLFVSTWRTKHLSMIITNSGSS